MNNYEFKAYCEEIRRNNKISDYIASAGIHGERRGDRITILCPFHKEKTASCVVNSNGGVEFFHCFGCGASGSIIDFCMKYENISLNDSIKKLGSGIDIDFDVDRLFEEHDRSVEVTDEDRIVAINISVSRSCYNYLREIEPIVDESVYKNEYDEINNFYKRLDKFIVDGDLETLEKIESRVCHENFIIDKIYRLTGGGL